MRVLSFGDGGDCDQQGVNWLWSHHFCLTDHLQAPMEPNALRKAIRDAVEHYYTNHNVYHTTLNHNVCATTLGSDHSNARHRVTPAMEH